MPILQSDSDDPDTYAESEVEVTTVYAPQINNIAVSHLTPYTCRCPSAIVAGTSVGIMLIIWDLQGVETD